MNNILLGSNGPKGACTHISRNHGILPTIFQVWPHRLTQRGWHTSDDKHWLMIPVTPHPKILVSISNGLQDIATVHGTTLEWSKREFVVPNRPVQYVQKMVTYGGTNGTNGKHWHPSWL